MVWDKREILKYFSNVDSQRYSRCHFLSNALKYKTVWYNFKHMAKVLKKKSNILSLFLITVWYSRFNNMLENVKKIFL